MFNGLKVEDIIHLKADFEWLDELRGKIEGFLKQQEENLRKAQIEEAKKAQEAKAMMDAEIFNEDKEEGIEGPEFSEEEEKPKRQTKKKTRKKRTKKKT